jgi:KUP system potassium uptake protein
MYSIKRIQSLPDCFHITVRYGYNQPMVPSDLASSIQTCVRSYVASHGVASGVANGSMKPSETTNIETSVLGTAYDSQEVVYVIGREELKIVPRANIFLVLILKAFVWIRNLSRSKVTQMDVLPTDDLVEIGFVKEI